MNGLFPYALEAQFSIAVIANLPKQVVFTSYVCFFFLSLYTHGRSTAPNAHVLKCTCVFDVRVSIYI